MRFVLRRTEMRSLSNCVGVVVTMVGVVVSIAEEKGVCVRVFLAISRWSRQGVDDVKREQELGLRSARQQAATILGLRYKMAGNKKRVCYLET